MTKRLPILVFTLVLIVSCGPQTHFDVDLENIVYQEGDLPVEGVSMEIQKVDGEQTWEYDNWIDLQISSEEAEIILDVNVVLFADKKERNKAFDFFSLSETQEGLLLYDPPMIGEETVGRKEPFVDGSSAVNITFQRCYSMVNIWAHIGMDPDITEESIYRYADALDKRLNNAVCPI